MAQHNHDNNDIEITQYTHIIEYFDEEKDPEEMEIWKYKKLIKLMEDLKQAKHTQEMIKNSIIIMNALTTDPCDEYTTLGTNTAELSEDERDSYRSHLRKELLIQ